jgi:hypothetical protein
VDCFHRFWQLHPVWNAGRSLSLCPIDFVTSDPNLVIFLLWQNPGGGNCATTAFLRPMMESMGVKYRPEVSLGVVVKDTVVDLTGVSVYWRGKFSDGAQNVTSINACKGGYGWQ